jgi:hypothetical protein
MTHVTVLLFLSFFHIESRYWITPKTKKGTPERKSAKNTRRHCWQYVLEVTIEQFENTGGGSYVYLHSRANKALLAMLAPHS